MDRRTLARPPARSRHGAFLPTPAPAALGVLFAALAWVLLPGANPAAAQLPDDEDVRQHGIFVDTLDVSLVNIEVHVTRDGEPVINLAADDFEILDDGEVVPITNFFRVEAGRRLEQFEPIDDGDVDTEQDVEVVREPSTVVVLIDHPYLSPLSRSVVFDKLESELETLFANGTRVMVVSKTSKIELVQPLTSSRGEVASVLDRMAQLSTPNYSAEVLQTVEAIQNSSNTTQARTAGPAGGASPTTTTTESDARNAFTYAQTHSQRQYSEARSSVELLRHFLGSLAGVPGRKAVIYVADRLPVRSGEMAWRVWYDIYGFDWGARFGAGTVAAALEPYDVSREVSELLADAAANRVAFYPVGAGADSGPNLMGAESRGIQSTAGGFTRAKESNEGLLWLADGTGGRAAIGRGDLGDFVDDLGRDLGHYYSLGYPTPHQGDGEEHEVEVRLLRPDLQGSDVKLRYLKSYRDKSAHHRALEQTLAALVLGADENPLGVRVELGESRKAKKKGQVTVPVEVHVPVANIVLLPGRSSHQGNVTVHLVVRDVEGRMAEPVRVKIPIEIPNAGLAQALSDSAVYRTELTLRDGLQALGVGVYDDLGSLGSALRVEVDTGARG